MSKKPKKSLAANLRSILIKMGLLGLVVGGYFLWQNPKLIEQILSDSSVSQPKEKASQTVSTAAKTSTQNMSAILGKTTSFVEEGLQNLKIPKQLSGSDEEIVLEEVVNDFTAKIKNLPQEQVDRIKIQFCEDLLAPIENVSVEVKNP